MLEAGVRSERGDMITLSQSGEVQNIKHNTRTGRECSVFIFNIDIYGIVKFDILNFQLKLEPSSIWGGCCQIIVSSIWSVHILPEVSIKGISSLIFGVKIISLRLFNWQLWHEIWQCDSVTVTVWQCDSVTVWQCDVWQCYSLKVWQNLTQSLDVMLVRNTYNRPCLKNWIYFYDRTIMWEF